jgi:hypothetical protein
MLLETSASEIHRSHLARKWLSRYQLLGSFSVTHELIAWRKMLFLREITHRTNAIKKILFQDGINNKNDSDPDIIYPMKRSPLQASPISWDYPFKYAKVTV